jgi:hypothetical protein
MIRAKGAQILMQPGSPVRLNSSPPRQMYAAKRFETARRIRIDAIRALGDFAPHRGSPIGPQNRLDFPLPLNRLNAAVRFALREDFSKNQWPGIDFYSGTRKHPRILRTVRVTARQPRHGSAVQ